MTERIRQVPSGGIVTEDGVERDVDVIIFGTGFKSHDFVAPMEVYGLGGRELNEAWRDGAEAYLGLSVNGFPELLHALRAQHESRRRLDHPHAREPDCARGRRRADAAREPGAYLDVRREAQAAFSREVQERLASSVWQTGGCTSWYRDETGRNTNNWPGLETEYRRRARELSLEHYRLVRTDRRELVAGAATRR